MRGRARNLELKADDIEEITTAMLRRWGPLLRAGDAEQKALDQAWYAVIQAAAAGHHEYDFTDISGADYLDERVDDLQNARGCQ
jgi:hypothetical protein